MRVEPKALIRQMTASCTSLLEDAVSRANSATCYEIIPEHMLLVMLEADDGDSACILQHYGIDRGALALRVERTLSLLRTGNGARPVFASNLFTWFEDAWLMASVEQGASSLRSGALLAQFAFASSRYTPEQYPELDELPESELKDTMEDIAIASHEAVEAAPTPGGPTAPQAKRGSEALARFTTSFTQQARDGKIDPVFARHREIRQMVDVLARRRKNNPIIVGEPGVGKTALVEGLALEIVLGNVPSSLRNVEIVGLDLGLLQAGAGVKGEFENRLKQVIEEVKSSPTPIVLFIDEAHTLIGAGGAAGGGDAANLLKPALARGELKTVAATTWSEYKKYFEKDAALERRFQPIKVEEPSEADAIGMLRGLCPIYEKAHDVSIRDEAIVAAVQLSSRYMSGRQLPDKAVDLLDTAAARVRVEFDAKPGVLIELEAKIATHERTRDALLRDQGAGHDIDEEELAEVLGLLAADADQLVSLKSRWEIERDAVRILREAHAALQEADIRAKQPNEQREAAADNDSDQPISEAPVDRESLLATVQAASHAVDELQGEEKLVHADVDADVVAQVVAGWTGIPVGKMKGDAVAAVLSLEDQLRKRVRGQDFAIMSVSEALNVASAGIRDPQAPVGVFLFVGPSGVGKTECALALADTLYGGERFLVTINMSEFQEKHTVSRLIGSPPGYVGYGEGGVLTEAVRQRPYSAVLLDECEKADLDVMNIFYQVFDKGSLSDGEGRDIDFRNTVVIMTSNLGLERIMELYDQDEPPTDEEVVTAIRPILSKHFKPALLARMTIVPFAPISPQVMTDIAKLKLAKLGNRLRETHGIETIFEDELIEELVRRCSEAELGARAIDHTLRGSLMPALARELLESMVDESMPSTLRVGLSPSGDWRLDMAD